MPPKRATRNSKQSTEAPPPGAGAATQSQAILENPVHAGPTSSTAGSGDATDSSWTDVVATGSASSTRTHFTAIIPTNNNISPPTTSTPIRRGPVDFSQYPELADTSDPPDIDGGTLLLDNGGPETSVSTSVIDGSTSPTAPTVGGNIAIVGFTSHAAPTAGGDTTTLTALPSPPEGTTSPPLLTTGLSDDPSIMTLDQILEKLTILNKLSERRWESMNARHSEVLLQCKTLDIKLGFHTESSKQVALKLSEVDALTARTATIASDALTVAEAARADSKALVDTLTKHFDDTISKLHSSLPTRSDANSPASSYPPSSAPKTTTSKDGLH